MAGMAVGFFAYPSDIANGRLWLALDNSKQQLRCLLGDSP